MNGSQNANKMLEVLKIIAEIAVGTFLLTGGILVIIGSYKKQQVKYERMSGEWSPQNIREKEMKYIVTTVVETELDSTEFTKQLLNSEAEVLKIEAHPEQTGMQYPATVFNSSNFKPIQ